MGRCKQFGVTYKGWYRGGNQVVGQCKKGATKDGYCWHHHPENKKPKLDLKSQIRQLKAQAKADAQRIAELKERCDGQTTIELWNHGHYKSPEKPCGAVDIAFFVGRFPVEFILLIDNDDEWRVEMFGDLPTERWLSVDIRFVEHGDFPFEFSVVGFREIPVCDKVEGE